MGVLGMVLVGMAAESKRAELEAKNRAEQEEKYMERLITKSKAVAALSVYAAATDGTISLDEYMEIDINVGAASENKKLPDEVLDEISTIYDKHDIKWEEVIEYLDAVPYDDIKELSTYLGNIVKSDDQVTEAEIKVIDQFSKYIESRN